MGAFGAVYIATVAESGGISADQVVHVARSLDIELCTASRFRVSGVRQVQRYLKKAVRNPEFLHDAADALETEGSEFLRRVALDEVGPFVSGWPAWCLEARGGTVLSRILAESQSVAESVRGSFALSELRLWWGPFVYWQTGDTDLEQVYLSHAAVSLAGSGSIKNRRETYRLFAELPVVKEIASLCEEVMGPVRIVVNWDN